jgi:hypothetical protein
MSIKVPRNERAYPDSDQRRSSPASRRFSKLLVGNLNARKAARDERQEALGIPTKAPVDGKSPSVRHLEELDRKLKDV